MDERVYYHAIYHVVTHWAGFYATVGLLLTLLFLLSTTKELDKDWCATVLLGDCCHCSRFLVLLAEDRPISSHREPNASRQLLARLVGEGYHPLIFIAAAIGTLGLGAIIAWLALERIGQKSK